MNGMEFGAITQELHKDKSPLLAGFCLEPLGLGKSLALVVPNWWRGGESNTGHEDFQSTALPTELPRHDRRTLLNSLSPVKDFLPAVVSRMLHGAGGQHGRR